jgi:hypothetical protein
MILTGSISTTARVPLLPALAVRLGHALEDWGTTASRPLPRYEVEQRRAAELERRRAEAVRDLSMHNAYRGIR